MTTTISTRRKEKKKKVIRLATLAVIIVIVALIGRGCGASSKQKKVDQLNEQISTLQKQNDELTAQKDAMQVELTEAQAELENLKQIQATDKDLFISSMFWSDGNFYEDTNGTKFYKEPSCETRIENDLKFVSPVICYDYELKNGQFINAVLSDQGLAFSVQEPKLEVYEEPEE